MHALTVGDMMTTQVRTLRKDETLIAADWDMVVGGFRHIPVVDQEHHLIGLVSDLDVVKGGDTNRSVAGAGARGVRAGGPGAPARGARGGGRGAGRAARPGGGGGRARRG